MPKGIKGFQKGNTIWLGKHLSEKTIEKIRLANTGRKISEKRKDNISNALLKYTSPQKHTLAWRRNRPYQKFRREVLIRDDFTCDKCGKKNSNIVHHIYDVFEHPEHWLNPYYSQVLCRACHCKIHPPTEERRKKISETMHKITDFKRRQKLSEYAKKRWALWRQKNAY